MTEPDRAPLRRYLLGRSSEDECAGIEREYLRDECSLERMLDVESELIEDYLADRLSGDERVSFDRHYLASPEHRRRLDVVRSLSAAASRSVQSSRQARTVSRSWAPMLAVAAALVIASAAAVVLVMRSRSGTTRPTAAASTSSSGSPSAGAPEPRNSGTPPRVLAVSLAPGIVRSAGDAATIVIPSSIDVVALQLETDGDVKAPARPVAAIRTVSGDEVWRGSASTDRLPTGVMARVEVPAERLSPDDYIVVLLDSVANGAAQERARYVLRVRGR